MARPPRVTRIEVSTLGYERFRIEGGDLAPEWAESLRPGRSAWCEITLWHESENLGGYGGEVWPGAWPALFEPLRSTVLEGSGRIRLTAAGREALEAARRADPEPRS